LPPSLLPAPSLKCKLRRGGPRLGRIPAWYLPRLELCSWCRSRRPRCGSSRISELKCNPTSSAGGLMWEPSGVVARSSRRSRSSAAVAQPTFGAVRPSLNSSGSGHHQQRQAATNRCATGLCTCNMTGAISP
jgi:hypothetical protein